MNTASIKESVKKLVKRILRIKAVNNALHKAKHYHQQYQNWLFQTKLVHVDRHKYLRYRLGGTCTEEEIAYAIETSPQKAIGEVPDKQTHQTLHLETLATYSRPFSTSSHCKQHLCANCNDVVRLSPIPADDLYCGAETALSAWLP